MKINKLELKKFIRELALRIIKLKNIIKLEKINNKFHQLLDIEYDLYIDGKINMSFLNINYIEDNLLDKKVKLFINILLLLFLSLINRTLERIKLEIIKNISLLVYDTHISKELENKFKEDNPNHSDINIYKENDIINKIYNNLKLNNYLFKLLVWGDLYKDE